MQTTVKAEQTCFVVMGFGKKPDYQTNRTLDLDRAYLDIIKPAVEEAGLICERADEIVHSGLIDKPMYEKLFAADVVIADLSTANNNAFYELGVRHALRPHTTIIIAEDQFKFPFDLGHILIRQYKHLGDDIGYGEVLRFRKLLTNAIDVILKKQPLDIDSPVYDSLDKLRPPALGDATAVAATGSGAGESKDTPPADEQAVSAETHSALMEQAEDAHQKGDFEAAKALFKAIREMRPDDPSVTQRLVVSTYKSRKPSSQLALEEARDLLKTLHPEKSNDPRTLGLWGTVHEYLWEETRDRAHLDEALRGYERSFNHSRDYFNGIHEAFLLNVRASLSDNPAEAIADFVLARRLRHEVIPICKEWLKSTKPSYGRGDKKRALLKHLQEKSWALATLAEAYLGTGGKAKAKTFFDKSEDVIEQLIANGYPATKAKAMRAIQKKKRADLQALLDDSPLKHISSTLRPTPGGRHSGSVPDKL